MIMIMIIIIRRTSTKKQDLVYDLVILRVHPVHTMNAEQRQVTYENLNQ